MASTPDENDMSWEETNAEILYSASEASNKRTFDQYIQDHHSPQSIPVRQRNTYNGILPIQQQYADDNVPVWYKRFGINIRTFVSITAQSTKRRLVSVVRRRSRRSPHGQRTALFRQIQGQDNTITITPPRFRSASQYRMPGSYPTTPPPPPQFEVPWLSPSPSPVSAYLTPRPVPGLYPPSPSPQVVSSPSPTPMITVPSPSPPSPVPVATPMPSPVPAAAPMPSPMPAAASPQETPQAVRELRQLMKKYGRKPQPARIVKYRAQEVASSTKSSPVRSAKPSPASSKKSSSARSYKSSPLSEQPGKGNVQTQWPSPLKKTVTFPDSPVTRTKRYVIGETIAFPSPGSSFDENSILSMISSPEAQWTSPTQEEQERFLEEQMLKSSPSVPVHRRLFAQPWSPTAQDSSPDTSPYTVTATPSLSISQRSPSHSPPDESKANDEMFPVLNIPAAPSRSSISTRSAVSTRMPPSEPQRAPGYSSPDRSNEMSDAATTRVTSTRISPSEPHQDPGNSPVNGSNTDDQMSEAPTTPAFLTRITPLEPYQDPGHSSPSDSNTSDEMSDAPSTPTDSTRITPSRAQRDPGNSSPFDNLASSSISEARTTPTDSTRITPSRAPRDPGNSSLFDNLASNSMSEAPIISTDSIRMTPFDPQQDPDHSSGDESKVSDQMFEAPIMSSNFSTTTPTKATKAIRSEPTTPEPDVATLLDEIALEDNPKKTPAGRRGARRTTKKEREAEKLRAEKAAKVAREKALIEKAEAAERAEKERLAAEERELREKTIRRRMPIEKVIQPLSAEWEEKITIALAKPWHKEVATSSTATPISRQDIGRVLPQEGKDPANGWLNDEIINACLQAVVQHTHEKRNHRRGSTPLVHAFNPFFWTNLKDHGPEKVSRWAAKAKIGKQALLQVEHVFIPVNRSGNHWTLLVVSPVARTIEYFDSLHGSADEPITKIKAWLAHELGASYRPQDWEVWEDDDLFGKGKGPKQGNMSDCGVFAITNAKMVSLGVDPMAVTAYDMPLQRKRIVAELLNGGLSGDFEPRIVFS